MSNPSSPSRDAVSSPTSSSAMDSSTFYSINDSDFENMNLSAATTDTSNRSLFSATSGSIGNKSADETLTNLSQTTLGFIRDEQKQQETDAANSNVNVSSKIASAVAPLTVASSDRDEATTKLSLKPNVTPPTPIITPPTPIATPASPHPSPAAANANTAAKNVAVAQARDVPDLAAGGDAKRTKDPFIHLIDNDDDDDDDDANDDDTSVIELSSDDDESHSERDTLTNHTLTDESRGSRTDSLADDDKTGQTAGGTAAVAAGAEVTVKMYSSVAEFERNLPPTVTLLEGPDGAKVYIVGTAHFSRESMDDVSLVIRNVRPSIVMVELCPSRIHILKHDEKTLLEEASNINLSNIRSIIRQNGALNGLFYIVLLKMSAKLTQELGMAPGGEFRRALEEVHRLDNCILHLGDRPINITLQRALHGLSLWQTLKIVWKLITTDEKISKEDVEKCKQADMLEELMAEMAGEYPEFRDVFVTERDLYLCHSLQVAATQHVPDGVSPHAVRPLVVVGVVGIGHVAGITQHWGKVNSDRIPEITTIPKPTRRSRVLKFAVKWTVLGAIGYGVYRVVGPRLPAVQLPVKLPTW